MALQCPICGAATAFQPAKSLQDAIHRGLSDGGKIIYTSVVADVIANQREDPDWYAVCKCQNCGRFFVVSKDEHWRDWWPVWPLPGTGTVSEDVSEEVRLAFEEARKCLAVRAYGGCLLMCRTTIIRLLRDRDVSSLKELKDNDVISGMLYSQADEVRYWANMVGHEDFDQEALTPEALAELMAFIEALLNAIYVEPARLAALKAARAEATSKKGKPD